MMYYCWALFGVMAWAFLHPYTTYPMSLRLLPGRPVRPDSALQRPTATLLFSAYNEERSLPAKLQNIAEIKAMYPDIQVLAYSDHSQDDTLALLQARPDLVRVISGEQRLGKATGMRLMVEQADHDICIFTDANVLLEPTSVGRLLDYFRDPAVGGVSGKLVYINDNDSMTASVGARYWKLEEAIKALESRCGSMMGADGSIFATRRSTYPHVPPHLLDDMIASISVVFAGLRLISGEGVIAYERSATDTGEEFRRKRRIACRAFNTHRHIRKDIRTHFGWLDRYKYVSHKLLRWFGAPVLVVAGLALTGGLILSGYGRIAAGLWVIAMLVAGAGAINIRPFNMAWNVALALLATFAGVLDSLCGKTYQTWAPAKSRD